MKAPRITRNQLLFLIGTPLAWAVLLWFHPDVARMSKALVRAQRYLAQAQAEAEARAQARRENGDGSS